MSNYKLDLYREVLPQLDRHNMDYYSTLSDDQKKGFHGVVVMRTMSHAEGDLADWYLIATNERANVHFFDIYEHPELQYKLLASNGFGKTARHGWIGNAKQPSNAALHNFILQYWPRANRMEVEVILGKFDKDSFSDFVDGTGIDTDEAKKIKKSFAAYK